MSTYRAPLQEMSFVLNELAGLAQVASLPGFEEATPDTVSAILEEAGEFRHQCARSTERPRRPRRATLLADGSVKTPRGFKEAYRQFIENGWNGLTKTRIRRAGLPQLVATPVEEMWHSANMAFDLCPLLTQGAIEALELCGNARTEGALPAEDGRRHVDGHDESDRAAGADRTSPPCARVRCRKATARTSSTARKSSSPTVSTTIPTTSSISYWRARRRARGRQRDLAVHRAEVLVNADGSLGARNDVTAYRSSTSSASREPDGVLAYGDKGGAVGYLIGEENAASNTCSS
jgi:hypothetical protein